MLLVFLVCLCGMCICVLPAPIAAHSTGIQSECMAVMLVAPLGHHRFRYIDNVTLSIT